MLRLCDCSHWLKPTKEGPQLWLCCTIWQDWMILEPYVHGRKWDNLTAVSRKGLDVEPSFHTVCGWGLRRTALLTQVEARHRPPSSHSSSHKVISRIICAHNNTLRTNCLGIFRWLNCQCLLLFPGPWTASYSEAKQALKPRMSKGYRTPSSNTTTNELWLWKCMIPSHSP